MPIDGYGHGISVDALDVTRIGYGLRRRRFEVRLRLLRGWAIHLFFAHRSVSRASFPHQAKELKANAHVGKEATFK